MSEFRSKISSTFVRKDPIDNKTALVQATAWRRTGNKPLTEQMLAQYTGEYMRRLVGMSKRIPIPQWLR